MNENCTFTVTKIGGDQETFPVVDVNQPYWNGCLSPEEYAHRVGKYGVTIESLDEDGNKQVRYIPPTCVCEVNVFCPCTIP